MEGLYSYDTVDRKWRWFMRYIGERVSESTCKHKGEMEQVDKDNSYGR